MVALVSSEYQSLHALAHEVGVLTSYHDYKGRLREARPDVLLRVLALLGLPIERADQAAEALRAHRRALWQTFIQPCAVAWDGDSVKLHLRVPQGMDDGCTVELVLESGETRRSSGHLRDVMLAETADIDGERHELRVVSIPVGQYGYHRARVEMARRSGECLVISGPTAGHRWQGRKGWGMFAPLYSVHREGGSGAGDLGDMMRLCRFTHEHGGSFVGTLPLLASFLAEPCEPSPYSPVSRLFWNELYLDLGTAPGLEICEDARRVLQSADFLARAEELRKLPLVDYRGQMAHKRAVLELLAEAAWGSDALRSEIAAYMKRHERADDYARFRAATEAQGRVWMDWPEPQRSGTLTDSDVDDRIRRYHLYVQYAMQAQLSRLDDAKTASLYLDLPVGVNRAGYDVWRERDVFVMAASAGAPPDPLFAEGQNWALPPLHPFRIREHGYRYFIDCIRHHVEHAGLLRIDHAMGLHRLYWIPEGVDTKDGIYVHYSAGEMYAIISLESHRHQCAIIGEDLGTVPDYLRPSMHHHGMSRLYVLQFSVPGSAESSDPERARIAPPPAESIASLNTHDTPTFSGFWCGQDIDDFFALGVMKPEEAQAEHAGRKAACEATLRFLVKEGYLQPQDISESSAVDVSAIVGAVIQFLGASDAQLMLVNIEDLWLETRPHNVPGTLDEHPNWRRKMRYTIDELMANPAIASLLDKLDEIRRKTS